MLRSKPCDLTPVSVKSLSGRDCAILPEFLSNLIDHNLWTKFPPLDTRQSTQTQWSIGAAWEMVRRWRYDPEDTF
jgi:hypothetical protein